MSNRSDMNLVHDIQEAIQRIANYLGEMSYDDFCEDIKTQDAVIRNIEIVGEAAKCISDKLRVKAPHIPWKNMAGMRDRLIHHYFGVNLDIVWQVVAVELPNLNSEFDILVDEDKAEYGNKEGG